MQKHPIIHTADTGRKGLGASQFSSHQSEKNPKRTFWQENKALFVFLQCGRKQIPHAFLSFHCFSTNVEAAAKLRPGSKSNKLSFQSPCHSSNNFSSADGMRELINHRVKNSDLGDNWEEKLGTLFARAEALKV